MGYMKKNRMPFIYENLQILALKWKKRRLAIRRMVREQGYRYGDFAVVSGDMEVYAPAASRAFGKYGIPCFIDQKHSIFMNPFVEYIRAAVDCSGGKLYL